MKTIFASILVLAACGHSGPLEPGAGDDPGGGTQTLVVNGSARATPRITNAQLAGDFDTDFTVRVTLNNVPVTTGTVTMTSGSGAVTLAFTTQQLNAWTGTAPGYDEVYQLDVTSDADTVTGVKVDGPDIHTFSQPMAGASVDTTMPLTLAWDRAVTADTATLGGNMGIDDLTITDTGSYDMAPNFLRADRQQARTDTLRLTRANRLTPAGAAAGSDMTVSVTNTLDVVALANPNAGN